MIAVIKTGGKQYLVQPGDKIEIEKLEIEAGKEVSFPEVLLLEKVRIDGVSVCFCLPRKLNFHFLFFFPFILGFQNPVTTTAATSQQPFGTWQSMS